MTPSVAERLAARTEALVAIPSESRGEEAILEEIGGALPTGWTMVADDAVRLAIPERRGGGARACGHGAGRSERPRPPGG